MKLQAKQRLKAAPFRDNLDEEEDEGRQATKQAHALVKLLKAKGYDAKVKSEGSMSYDADVRVTKGETTCNVQVGADTWSIQYRGMSDYTTKLKDALAKIDKIMGGGDAADPMKPKVKQFLTLLGLDSYTVGGLMSEADMTDEYVSISLTRPEAKQVSDALTKHFGAPQARGSAMQLWKVEDKGEVTVSHEDGEILLHIWPKG